MSTVRDILQKKGRAVWSVMPTAPVFDAIKEMAEQSVSALLVMDGFRLAGIVTERDYARKVILQGKSSKETPVHAIMTSDLRCCSLDDTVRECMALMTAHRVRHVPVLDVGQVVGIVSMGDVVKFIMTEQERAIDELQRYVAG